jgi:hypothetical protein
VTQKLFQTQSREQQQQLLLFTIRSASNDIAFCRRVLFVCAEEASALCGCRQRAFMVQQQVSKRQQAEITTVRPTTGSLIPNRWTKNRPVAWSAFLDTGAATETDSGIVASRRHPVMPPGVRPRSNACSMCQHCAMLSRSETGARTSTLLSTSLDRCHGFPKRSDVETGRSLGMARALRARWGFPVLQFSAPLVRWISNTPTRLPGQHAYTRNRFGRGRESSTQILADARRVTPYACRHLWMRSRHLVRYSLRFLDRADEARMEHAGRAWQGERRMVTVEPLRLPGLETIRPGGRFPVPAFWISAIALIILGLFWKLQQRLDSVFLGREELAERWRAFPQPLRPPAKKPAYQRAARTLTSPLGMVWARLRFHLEALLQRQHSDRIANKTAPVPRRWFADVSDLYEAIIRQLPLSIEDTRCLFTLLSADEQHQYAGKSGAYAPASSNEQKHLLPALSRAESIAVARKLCILAMAADGVLHGSARAALAQLLLPHLPKLSAYISAHPRTPQPSGPLSRSTIVGLLFSNAMIPHIMLGAAVVATSAGARVCIIDDWRSTLSTTYAPFLLAVGLNPYPTLAESCATFDRLRIALYRSPIGLAKRDIRLLLNETATAEDVATLPAPLLGDLVAPLLNAYDLDRLVTAPGLHAPSGTAELEALTDAVAFFRPVRAWLFTCLVPEASNEDTPTGEQHLGCLLPWGQNSVREVCYRGPNADGEEIAQVAEIPLQPHRYQMYSKGDLAAVIGANAVENARLLEEVLTNTGIDDNAVGAETSSLSSEHLVLLRETIVLNAAIILLASGLVQTIHEGIQAARQAMYAPSTLGRHGRRPGAPYVPSDAAALWRRMAYRK